MPERFVTLYGRMPVLEALVDERAKVDRVLVARNAQGEAIDRIVDAAARRGLRVERTDPHRITRLSGNGRHDQGVVVQVSAPGLEELDEWLAARADASLCVIVLDGLTNPANVGMIIRTAVAAGLDGIVLPRAGSPDVGPLVVKASAGVALFAPVLRAETSREATGRLRNAGVSLVGLSSSAPTSIWDAGIDARTAFVLGNETLGVSPAVADIVSSWASVPLRGGVESLNVAAAATVVAFEVARRRALAR